MDMHSYGTPENKSMISFMMCDIDGSGKVHKEQYRDFCLKFLIMYEELMHTKIEIS